MFYSGNENYMQDLYNLNQIPNPTYNSYVANPNATIPANANSTPMNMGANMNYMFMPNNTGFMNDPNRNMMQNNQLNYSCIPNMNMQNPNNLFPSIYRIINPVVSRVISGSNMQVLTEDNLNNMVDTVYNIVEGQIEEYSDTENERNIEERERTSANVVNNNSNLNTNTSGNNSRNTNISVSSNLENRTSSNNIANMSSTNSNSRNVRHKKDPLLKDLIKILILKEWISRCQNRFLFQNSQQQFVNQNFMQPYFYQNM